MKAKTRTCLLHGTTTRGARAPKQGDSGRALTVTCHGPHSRIPNRDARLSRVFLASPFLKGAHGLRRVLLLVPARAMRGKWTGSVCGGGRWSAPPRRVHAQQRAKYMSRYMPRTCPGTYAPYVSRYMPRTCPRSPRPGRGEGGHDPVVVPLPFKGGGTRTAPAALGTLFTHTPRIGGEELASPRQLTPPYGRDE